MTDVPTGGDREETEDERADRNFGDLLQELRVTETAVAVLFSALLTVPFSARFDRATPAQEREYVAALLLAASAAVVTVAPVAYHRMLFAQGQKPRVVRMSGRLAVTGLVLLVLAIAAVLLLVLDVLFSTRVALEVAIAFAALTGLLWFLPPVARKVRRQPFPRS